VPLLWPFADPHPGNVFLTDDHRIALIDLGMVGRLAPRLQEQLLPTSPCSE
jgi:predicted unusual protein kinase regulating ubiquinone biosynthesis (AarF/ABC1/UbiB family)